MTKCGDCVHFKHICDKYVEADESFPEVGGCRCFKNKADFVEVVRCKDCKFYHTGKQRSALWEGHTPYCCKSARARRNPNDFCSYGERKENNED